MLAILRRRLLASQSLSVIDTPPVAGGASRLAVGRKADRRPPPADPATDRSQGPRERWGRSREDVGHELRSPGVYRGPCIEGDFELAPVADEVEIPAVAGLVRGVNAVAGALVELERGPL